MKRATQRIAGGLLTALLTVSIGFSFTSSTGAQNDGTSDHPEVVDPTDDLSNFLSQRLVDYKETQANLRQELRTLLNGLDTPSPANVSSAIDQFRMDNQDRILDQIQLASQIRIGLAIIRQNRPERPDAPAFSTELNNVKENMSSMKEAFAQDRQNLIDTIAGTPQAAVEAAIDQFRQQQIQNLNELKELRRNLIEGSRGSTEGDRRTDG